MMTLLIDDNIAIFVSETFVSRTLRKLSVCSASMILRSNGSDDGSGGLQVSAAQASSHGCTADIDWHEDRHPTSLPTVNDKQTYLFSKSVAER